LAESTADVRRIPWLYVAGVLAVVAIVVTMAVRRADESTTPLASSTLTPAAESSGTSVPASTSTPPDISAMMPRERFDRLFDRVMRASEGGDSAEVAQFSPMALAAYGALPAVDADARFHAALIKIATGDLAGATALANEIASTQSTHLFGFIVRGTVAERQQDQAALSAAWRAFLAAYPSEIAAGREEYSGHQVVIDRFLSDAKLVASTGP
jgi:hypothetical protein